MARNKYPEQTVKRIIDTSLQLFIEKGYEQTTIQDIINALGDLSKGAIYHHFKSKEDIMQAVSDEMDKDSTVRIAALKNRKDLTGLQKMRQLAMDSMDDDTQATLLSAVPNILKNPRFLAEQIYSGDKVVAPLIEEFIREGIADGSITTDHPKEASQILTLLLNIWLNPLVFSCTQEELLAKFRYLQQITTSMLGTPILDDSILERLDKYRLLTCGSPASPISHPTK